MLHIWYFNIADCTAAGKRLELGLEFKLVKGVDFLGNMNMVAVGDISLVGNAFDYAETAL